MNVLADFIVRVEEQYPLSIENEELNALLTTIRNQAREIETLNKEVSSMRLNIEHYNEEHALREGKEKAPAKDTAETPAPKKRTRKPKAATDSATTEQKPKKATKPRTKKAEQSSEKEK